MLFFARWDREDRFLQIRIASHFLQSVARTTLDQNPGQIELLPKFRTRDPQLESSHLLANDFSFSEILKKANQLPRCLQPRINL
jgi:hypothetical protein